MEILAEYPILMPMALIGVLVLSIVGIYAFLRWVVKNQRAISDIKKHLGIK